MIAPSLSLEDGDFITKRVGEENGYYGIFHKSKQSVEEVDETGTTIKTKVEWFEPCGRVVRIEKIIDIFETDEVFWVLGFNSNGIPKIIEISRGDLKKNVLLDYAKMGLDAFEHTIHTLIKFLQYQETTIEPTFGHIHVGFDIYTDENGTEIDVFKHYEGHGFESEYRGDLTLGPTGDIDEYRMFIDEHISGTPLELGIALGLVGLLVGFIGADVECDNIVIHLFGDSSSGKTSCAVVAVAMGSKPVFKGHTLMRRYNGTENALLAVVVGNTGLAIAYDEAKSASIRDFCKFIYTIESGTEKLRLDKDASIKDVREYHTCVVSTGEYSLTDDTEHATGKEIRLQQFGNIAWTRSAEHSETVKRFFRRNYGLPCVLLAQYLLELGRDVVIASYEKHRRIFLENSKSNDTFSERLSIKYGLILAAVELAREALDFNLSYDLILNMLVQNELESADSRDLAQVAYDFIIGQVNVYNAHFSWVEKEAGKVKIWDAAKDVWGLRERHAISKGALVVMGNYHCETIYIEVSQMKKMLLDGKFKDIDVIISKWKERDLLRCDGGHNTVRRKILSRGNRVRLYAIKIFDNPSISNDFDVPKEKSKRVSTGEAKARLVKSKPRG